MNLNPFIDKLNKEWSKLLTQYPFMEQPNWMQDKTIVLFGTGGAFVMDYLYFKEQNITPSFLCDNSPSQQGKQIDGIQIIAPWELKSLHNVFVIVTIRNFLRINEVCQQLQGLQIDHIPFFTYFILTHGNELSKVYDMLEDDRSKEVFSEIIHMGLSKKEQIDEIYYDDNQYFALKQFSFKVFDSSPAIYVDAGAFVGDTAEEIICRRYGSFNNIYCFEPGERTFKALTTRMNRLKQEWAIEDNVIECINAGLGKQTTKLLFAQGAYSGMPGSGTYFAEGPDCVEMPVYSLDDYLDGKPVTFIKADIEGSEMDLLLGAEQTIRTCKPLIAICIYHKPSDLYEIPFKIKELVPEYKFAIRHHSYSNSETVLYCYL